jgi:hypothetical protein
MGHFSTSGKEYPEGGTMSGFGEETLDVTAAPTPFQKTAPPVLYDDTSVLRKFLYWDTGRRITNKRTVRWTFNHPDSWSDWRAVAWYGVPPTGPGGPFISVGAHWVGVSPIHPTPVDGPGSTFVNGPGGSPLAWPWSGDDHVVTTQFGAETIHALAHLQRSAGDPVLDFSSWQQLIYGGDDTSYFAENDDDIGSTSSGSGVTGIENSTSPDFAEAMGAGGVLLAGYVTAPPPDYGGIIGRLRDVINAGVLGKFIDMGDPSPEDIIRLKLISESIDLVRGQKPTGPDAFEGLLVAAKSMSAAELKRTIVGTQTTLRRGQAALRSLEALAAKQASARQLAAKPKKSGK